MVRLSMVFPVFCVLWVVSLGCAGTQEKTRVNRFAVIANAYQNAIRNSDFKNARQFLDQAAVSMGGEDPIYKKVMVSDYRVVKIAVSPDRREIYQQAEIEFHISDRPIVRKMVDRQHWRYSVEREMWLLQSGLPDFTPE